MNHLEKPFSLGLSLKQAWAGVPVEAGAVHRLAGVSLRAGISILEIVAAAGPKHGLGWQNLAATVEGRFRKGWEAS